MKSFKQFNEDVIGSKQLPWVRHATTWLGANNKSDDDSIWIYHGSHQRNTENIIHNGITKPDPKTGLVSFALDPHTAHGYAAMSGSGGESNFRQLGTKVVNTPHEERHVHAYKVPKTLVNTALKENNYGGNLDADKEKLTNPVKYHSLLKTGEHPYSLTEVRFTPEQAKDIHNNYYQGFMSKTSTSNIKQGEADTNTINNINHTQISHPLSVAGVTP